MKILIYGMGNMGTFFHNFFLNRGYNCDGYDIVEGKGRVEKEDIGNYDVIFLCIPMDKIEDTLETIKIYATSPLLVDIASIKEQVLSHLEKSGMDYLSVHPMFGPGSEIGLSNIIVVKESDRNEEEVILGEFKRAGAVLSRLPQNEHDRKMAEIQGIAHFTLLGMANFLNDRFSRDELVYASPIFSVLYKLASRILNQDWKMYYLIQQNAQEVRKEFLDKMEELEENFYSEENFKEIFDKLRPHFTEFKDSTLILDAYKATEDVEDMDLLRGYIMAIDSLLLRLIEKRTDAGKKIALHKKDRNEPIELLDVEGVKIKDILNRTDLNSLYVQNIFEDVMRLTKEEEYKILGICKTVSVLGPAGSFSEEAALKLVGSRLPLRYSSTSDEIIRSVEEGNVDYGLVPIENSVNGTVLPVLDALLNSDVEVFGETSLEINHCLVANRNIPLKEVKAVYSHPQAIAQSMGFINNYLPQADIRYTSSTSDAVSLLDNDSTAIVSENAAKLHRLYILKKRIQDMGGQNITRFYVIRKRGEEKLGGHITSLFFGAEDKPGSLKSVLEVFHKRDINMRKLESRPAKTGLGDYIFFVEAEKELNEEELKELRSVTTFCYVVGIFDPIEKIDVWG
ncbi:MAG: prephenate dehydratase [Archaeoglobaceae archaeon]